MQLKLMLAPGNVSFYRLTIIEFQTNAVNIRDYFTNSSGFNLEKGFQQISQFNIYYDDVSASLSGYNFPLYPGSYEYDVPTAWWIAGSSQTNMMGYYPSHFKILNSNGDFSADKYNITVERTTNDVISVSQ